MRQNDRIDPRKAKKIARRQYHNRQVEKFIKYSLENKGYVKFKDIVEVQEKYNIKAY
jgi:hypothetical protein